MSASVYWAGGGEVVTGRRAGRGAFQGAMIGGSPVDVPDVVFIRSPEEEEVGQGAKATAGSPARAKSGR